MNGMRLFRTGAVASTALFLLLSLAGTGYGQPDTTRFWIRSGAKWHDVRAHPDGGELLTGEMYYEAPLLARIDAAGELVMENEINHASNPRLFAGVPLANGSSVFAGQYDNVHNNDQSLVVSLSPDHTPTWIRTFQSAESQRSYLVDIVPLPDGGFTAVGSRGNDWSAFVWKLGPQGQFQWRYDLEYGGFWLSFEPQHLATTPDGGYRITGTENPFSSSKIRIVRLNAEGDLLWSHLLPEGELSANGHASVPGEYGACIVVGNKNNGDYFSGFRAYVASVSPIGEVYWDFLLDGFVHKSTAEDVITVADGNLLAVIATRPDTQDLNYYHRLIKFTTGGDILWEQDLDLPGFRTSLCQNRDGAYVVAGEVGLMPTYGLYARYEPEVVAVVEPGATTVPENGGFVSFDLELSNILTHPAQLDVWLRITTPGGMAVALDPLIVHLQAGQPMSLVGQGFMVPADAPAGEYRCDVHVGQHPDPMRNMALDGFSFTKTGATAGLAPDGESWRVAQSSPVAGK